MSPSILDMMSIMEDELYVAGPPSQGVGWRG